MFDWSLARINICGLCHISEISGQKATKKKKKNHALVSHIYEMKSQNYLNDLIILTKYNFKCHHFDILNRNYGILSHNYETNI